MVVCVCVCEQVSLCLHVCFTAIRLYSSQSTTRPPELACTDNVNQPIPAPMYVGTTCNVQFLFLFMLLLSWYHLLLQHWTFPCCGKNKGKYKTHTHTDIHIYLLIESMI